MLGAGRGQQSGERGHGSRLLGEHPGRVAELEDGGVALTIDDDRGRVAGPDGLLDAGTRCDEFQECGRRAVDRDRVAAARVSERRAEPLECPSSAQTQPGNGEEDNCRKNRGAQRYRAVGGAEK